MGKEADVALQDSTERGLVGGQALFEGVKAGCARVLRLGNLENQGAVLVEGDPPEKSFSGNGAVW